MVGACPSHAATSITERPSWSQREAAELAQVVRPDGSGNVCCAASLREHPDAPVAVVVVGEAVAVWARKDPGVVGGPSCGEPPGVEVCADGRDEMGGADAPAAGLGGVERQRPLAHVLPAQAERFGGAGTDVGENADQRGISQSAGGEQLLPNRLDLRRR